MSQLSLISFLREQQQKNGDGGSSCLPVNLFTCCGTPRQDDDVEGNDGTPRTNSPRSNPDLTSIKQSSTRCSVVVDSECCLDRLYGGYYSDWASGGQWNRMLSYVANLAKACRTNKIQLTIAFRGGLEKEFKDNTLKCNQDFKERLNRVMLHLQNRGTPPPKVWWVTPTGLREVLCLAFHVYGIPVFFSDGDYYTDVMSYVHTHNVDGILTDDPAFAVFNPPRLFGAHDFKLTYKGSLETKEYLLDQYFLSNPVLLQRLPLFASLLGNHIVRPDSLKGFYADLSDVDSGDSASKSTEEGTENAVIAKIISYVSSLPDPIDISNVASTVFANSTICVEEGAANLTSSIDYYKTFTATHKSVPPPVVTTQLDIQPVKSDGKQRKRNAVVDNDGEVDGVISKGSDDAEDSGKSFIQSKGDSSLPTEPVKENGIDGLAVDTLNLSINGNTQTNIEKLHITVTPGEAILKLAVERHSKGLMAPPIVQSLIQREVRLPCYIEECNKSTPSIIEIYRPIRQSVYAILHNLNKHLYDARKIAEEEGNTVVADDISITVVENYLGPLGVEVNHKMKVKPVPWPVPSIESLWLGVKPENKQRRMKAFISCMNVGANPHITEIQEHYLLICCVLRYLLKCEPMPLSIDEVDAVLSMATSPIVYDVQTMQDLQLQVITPRGAHVASVVMAGIQHAILVNDTCGAPIRKQSTFPWMCFDGKLLQYKLLKNGSSPMQRLDLCDGNMEQLMLMEWLRQAVVYGMEGKLGDRAGRFPLSLASALPAGRMFAAPAAVLRPFVSASRGKGSLMGEFAPVNARLDGRGGKLQVAGQVVATWGPRPAGNRDGVRSAEISSRVNGFGGPQYHGNQPRSHRRRQGYQQNRPSEHRNKNQNNSLNKADKLNSPKSVVIVTKDEGDEETTDVIVTKQTEPEELMVPLGVARQMNGLDGHASDMA